jgi:hypothetical protein
MNMMTTERMAGMGMSMPTMGGSMMGMPMMMSGMTGSMPSMMPGMGSGMMMPRCMMKMEKCPGGMKLMCVCEDKTSAMMLQNMCMMMAGGMCSCCMMMNGMCCCCCNMGMMGMCEMEMTEMGCTMTCTSGDKMCEKMIQACCDCMNAMMGKGMTCMMMMNGMPMCCCVC